MKLITLCTIIVLTFLTQTNHAQAQEISASKSFSLSVTIPSSVGLNTPAPSLASMLAPNLTERLHSQIIQETRTVKGRGTVTFRSIVVL